MYSHWISFLAATVFDELCYFLDYINDKLGYSIPFSTWNRIKIAAILCILVAIIMYAVVQTLMLIVVIRYGSPIEEDMKILIVKKLL